MASTKKLLLEKRPKSLDARAAKGFAIEKRRMFRMRLVHSALFFSLSALLMGCVSTDAERASLAASPEQAIKQAQLDPAMRGGIAQAVESTHPMTRLLTNNVLVAEISNERSETSELDRSKYIAYYCVNVTIERPLLDWHRVFIVHPVRESGRGNLPGAVERKRYAQIMRRECNAFPRTQESLRRRSARWCSVLKLQRTSLDRAAVAGHASGGDGDPQRAGKK